MSGGRYDHRMSRPSERTLRSIQLNSWLSMPVRHSAGDDRIGLDFDQHVRIDQAFDFDHGCNGPDVPEDFAVRAAYFLPLIDVGHVDACPNDVVERRACLLQRGFDGLEGLYGLRVGIALADQPGGRHCRRARYVYR